MSFFSGIKEAVMKHLLFGVLAVILLVCYTAVFSVVTQRSSQHWSIA